MPLLGQIPASQVDDANKAARAKFRVMVYYYYMAMVHIGHVKYNEVFGQLIQHYDFDEIQKEKKIINLDNIGFNMSYLIRAIENYVIDPNNKLNLSDEFVLDWYRIQWDGPYYEHTDAVPTKLIYANSNNMEVDFWNWPYGVTEEYNRYMIPKGDWSIDFNNGNRYVFIDPPDVKTEPVIIDTEIPKDLSIDETETVIEDTNVIIPVEDNNTVIVPVIIPFIDRFFLLVNDILSDILSIFRR